MIRLDRVASGNVHTRLIVDGATYTPTFATAEEVIPTLGSRQLADLAPVEIPALLKQVSRGVPGRLLSEAGDPVGRLLRDGV